MLLISYSLLCPPSGFYRSTVCLVAAYTYDVKELMDKQCPVAVTYHLCPRHGLQNFHAPRRNLFTSRNIRQQVALGPRGSHLVDNDYLDLHCFMDNVGRISVSETRDPEIGAESQRESEGETGGIE